SSSRSAKHSARRWKPASRRASEAGPGAPPRLGDYRAGVAVLEEARARRGLVAAGLALRRVPVERAEDLADPVPAIVLRLRGGGVAQDLRSPRAHVCIGHVLLGRVDALG